jgi:hypothetical protein
VKGRKPIPNLDPLERANLNHRTKSKNPVILSAVQHRQDTLENTILEPYIFFFCFIRLYQGTMFCPLWKTALNTLINLISGRRPLLVLLGLKEDSKNLIMFRGDW